MIAVDTNILVHAHRGESPLHAPAVACLERVAATRWAIPWPCMHEFLAITTHPRVFDPPSALEDAMLAIRQWLAAPTLHVLSETESHWDALESVLESSRVVGPRIHDARIAALCVEHAVSELWTADRDFSRFRALRTTNPLVG